MTTFDKKSGGTTFLVALYKGMSFGVCSLLVYFWSLFRKVFISLNEKLNCIVYTTTKCMYMYRFLFCGFRCLCLCFLFQVKMN